MPADASPLDAGNVLVSRRRATGGTRPAPGRPTCALTVDVEDWYQSCVDLSAPISERVVENNERLLEVLDECGVRATFFVQGLVAEAFPRLVSELVQAGHEVQSHGHTHRSLRTMGPGELREELERGKAAVEDAGGVTVTAFRAPDFSVGEDNLWALEAISTAGFQVDSSIFPMRTRRYGVSGWEVAPEHLELRGGAVLLEVPVAVRRVGGVRLPLAGGGYLRLAPSAVVERGLRSIVGEGRPAIVYSHPYEFNPDELEDYRGLAPERFRRTQGLGRRAFVRRLRRLFASLPFGRLDEVLDAWGVDVSGRPTSPA